MAIVTGIYFFAGSKAAWSALAGGGVNTAGQVYFLLKTYRSRLILTPKAALRYFYRTELLKIAVIFSLLALVLTLFKLNVWIDFMTFVAAQCLGSFAPLCTFKHRGI
ncbi:MAG: ATP synthase subunit I [Gammaproteobacteria bacterium]|nr:ATP synthase subunit I [Gammaproteobacteria bacterium]